jgi:hypothetical protein
MGWLRRKGSLGERRVLVLVSELCDATLEVLGGFEMLFVEHAHSALVLKGERDKK